MNERTRKELQELMQRLDSIYNKWNYNGEVDDLQEFENIVIRLQEIENENNQPNY